MKKLWFPLLALGVAMSVTACGSTPAPAPAGPILLEAHVTRLDPPADAPVADLVAGIGAFGYDLTPASASENWVASPASIALVFAMVRAGALGVTATELDGTFGFPTRLHEAFNALSRQLVTADIPSISELPAREAGAPARPSIVSIGNAIFPAQGFPIREAYLTVLGEQYGTGVYPVDFHQVSALDSINAWARELTAGRIDQVFEQLDPQTAAVLANTAYFKGEWQVPFDGDNTVDATFRRSDGSTVTAPTMSGDLSIGYAEGPGWQAIELPYGQDGAYAMRVLLPTGGLSPRDLLAPSLQPSFANRRVDVRMPRWDFAADVPLKEELIRLGLASVFDPTSADLSGISEIDLYISQAVHRANISVDEYGSEAAAVTAAAFMPTSAPPSATVSFHADRPFAFSIVHRATGAPLFYGMVADPTAG